MEIKRLVETCGADLAGTRERALFLIGFADALRRSELVGPRVEHVAWTKQGKRLLIVRSKTDKAKAPRSASRTGARPRPARSPLKEWLQAGKNHDQRAIRKVTRWGVEPNRLRPDAVRQILLKRAAQAGLKGTPFEPVTPHGMRAGFVTAAYQNGVPDEEILGHTPWP